VDNRTEMSFPNLFWASRILILGVWAPSGRSPSIVGSAKMNCFLTVGRNWQDI
jgi:hypothetical protein